MLCLQFKDFYFIFKTTDSNVEWSCFKDCKNLCTEPTDQGRNSINSFLRRLFGLFARGKSATMTSPPPGPSDKKTFNPETIDWKRLNNISNIEPQLIGFFKQKHKPFHQTKIPLKSNILYIWQSLKYRNLFIISKPYNKQKLKTVNYLKLQQNNFTICLSLYV